MADAKISALTELPAFPAAGDPLPIVDVSDTTDAPSGTTKKITRANLFDVPAARVLNGSVISHATSGTAQALTFDAERFDTDAIHDLSTNTGRLTCKTAGLYLITGHIVWAFHATGRRLLQVRLNGATFLAGDQKMAVTESAQLTHQSIATIYQLAVNDYVELIANQTSGGALNINASGNQSPEFGMIWQGTG